VVETLEEETVVTGPLRKMARRAAVAALVLLVASQLIRPARTNPVTDPSRTLAARIPITAEVKGVLERGCRDCHSNDTRWPWYSNMAPVSWFVIDHVNSGRRHVNYSDWPPGDADETRKVLKNTCDLVRKGSMPISNYLWMHSDARLSARDIDALCAWSAEALRANFHGR
jgi:hypothetical protein